MSKKNLRHIDFTPEFQFKSSRSSGKGGQHVNKTETRISLFFDINNSELLDEKEKETLKKQLKNKLSNEGVLQIDAEQTRSQLKNKKQAIASFYKLLEDELEEGKKRIATKPSKEKVQKRLKKKKLQAEKKLRRKKNLSDLD